MAIAGKKKQTLWIYRKFPEDNTPEAVGDDDTGEDFQQVEYKSVHAK